MSRIQKVKAVGVYVPDCYCMIGTLFVLLWSNFSRVERFKPELLDYIFYKTSAATAMLTNNGMRLMQWRSHHSLKTTESIKLFFIACSV